MSDDSSGGRPPGPGSREAGDDVVWAVLVWGRVVMGLLLAGVAGVAFGHAWSREYAPYWWVGAISLLAGSLLVLSGLYARSRPPGAAPEIAMRQGVTDGEQPLVPLLGALLVYKYQRITQRQLSEALAQQHREGEHRRRLGEILVAMGAITEPHLEEALEFQRSVLRERMARQAG